MLDPIIKEKIDKAFSVSVKNQTEGTIWHIQHDMNKFLDMSGISGRIEVTASVDYKYNLIDKE